MAQVVAGGLLALALIATGLALDAARPLPQPALFLALQAASGGGALLGVVAWWRGLPDSAPPRAPRWAALLVVAAGWRLAWFPIMVFSGHVASVGEWLLVGTGLPVVVYPTFLLAVAGLHGLAALAAIQIVWPLAPWLRWALLPAFLVAACVSFLRVEDLRPLPDTELQLSAQVPEPRSQGGNPYLDALVGPGYLPHQRVILVAAGLTYATIPSTPWAVTVRETLGELFRQKPRASTRDRVVEHYRAYHAAHFRVGCRRLEACPAAP